MVKLPYAQLPVKAFTIAEAVDRNRRKLRPDTAKGAVADLFMLADRSKDGSIPYNPHYWALRWGWNDNEASRLIKRLVRANIFSVRKNHGQKTRSLIFSKNIVSGNVSGKQLPSKHGTTAPQGKQGKVVSFPQAEGKEVVSELPSSHRTTENTYSANLEILAVHNRKRKTLTGQVARWFMDLHNAYGDKRGRAEAAWVFSEIDGLCQELVYNQIIPAARAYALERQEIKRKGLTPKMLTFWLTGLRWQDYDPTTEPASGQSQAEETRKRYLSD